MPTSPTAQAFTFAIRRGARHDMVFQYSDVDTGDPYPFLTDPNGTWVGRMDLKNRAGDVIATYRSDDTGDGTITFDDDGRVSAHMPAEASEALDFQVNYLGQRVNNEQVYADLELTDPADDEPQVDWVGTGVITQEVTAHA